MKRIWIIGLEVGRSLLEEESIEPSLDCGLRAVLYGSEALFRFCSVVLIQYNLLQYGPLACSRGPAIRPPIEEELKEA